MIASARLSSISASVAVLLILSAPGCAFSKKKISPKSTYRAGYLGSTDGKSFHPLLELLEFGEKAKPACRAVNRKLQTKAQYLIERRDSGITVRVKECESTSTTNCAKLESCLKARPVAWLSRASGRAPEFSGTIYTDWLGRCGGMIAVNFYYGPLAELPIEKVGCAEPQHDAVDTAYEMYGVSRFDAESVPAAPPYIENLLKKWDTVVFNTIDATTSGPAASSDDR